ncbi:MAG TPA: peptide ABC transporter substrate-binding protein [Candidatus Dormibacteraeota bacterium]|jgi:oligopeptide transport system substrate-binding protein|nr:peptide ABC transporter substrate-binding protein [Candidatus Dormibacteraeota bacterium]
MRLTWRFPQAFCVLGATGLLVAACGGGGGGAPSQRLASDQTLRFPILGDFTTLDPGRLDAETDAEVAQNLFDGLLKFDDNLKMVPDIAQSMPDVSPDGLTYTFHLRHDVKFWNGDPVTAKDVIYSWNRGAVLQGSYATNLSAIEGYDKVSKYSVSDLGQLETLLENHDPAVSMSGLTAPDGMDGYTVQVKLSSPAGWFLSAIAMSGTTGNIVDYKAIRQDPNNWWQKPDLLVGTGPYRMTSHVVNQSVDFQAVDNWWGSPKPTVKHVHLDIINDASTAIAAYEQGKYDLVGFGGYSNLPLADVLRIKNNPQESKQLLLHPKSRSYWVTFNLVADSKRKAKGPFTMDAPDSRDLRLAFDLAVDKTKLVSVVCQNVLCTPATGGVLTKGLKGYLGDNQDPLAKFDPAQARSLLKKADPDGSKTRGLTYVYDPENPLNKPTAEFLQDQWQTNLGVHVDIQPEAHKQFIPDRLAGNFVLSRDGWQADYDHPQDWFDNLWGSKLGCPDANCSSGYTTPAYDQLLQKADSEPLAQALPDYQKLSRMLINDVVYIPLYYTVGAFLIKPYVKGAGTNSQFDYYWDGYKILQH